MILLFLNSDFLILYHCKYKFISVNSFHKKIILKERLAIIHNIKEIYA